MKILFTIAGENHSIWLADRSRKIFGVDGKFYTEPGREVPQEDSFCPSPSSKEENDEAEMGSSGKYDKISGGISAFSTIEEKYEIDDIFGNYGFKDAEGNVIIEPQFESAREFAKGLCAVMPKRTWYHTPKGNYYYETLWGYIDTLGKVRIPYMFQEVTSFNQYGVAVVWDDEHSGYYLIDTTGKMVEGSLFPYLSMYGWYHERYLEFSYHDESEEEPDEGFDIGLYDTKERRIAIAPCAKEFFVEKDNLICAARMKSKISGDIESNLYLDNEGNELFPWQSGKKFDYIECIDDEGNTVAGYIDETRRKIWPKNLRVGLLNDKGEFSIPVEYQKILRIDRNFYQCIKKDCIDVICVANE